MHRWVVFFSAWAIAVLASEDTLPLSEEFPFGNPEEIRNPTPLNPEFDPNDLQTPEPMFDQETENPIPLDEIDDQEDVYLSDEQKAQQDDYQFVQLNALNSYPSENDIKFPTPINPDPEEELGGEDSLFRQNGTVRDARAGIAPPSYHGGKVLINPINIYIIWYGNWRNLPGDQEMIKYFFNNIQNSGWWNLATRYTQTKNGVTSPVTSQVRLAGSVQAPLSQGNSLGSPQVVYNIVNQVLLANSLPADPNGLYFVLSAPNIAVANFCVNFCGWHSGFNYKSSTEAMSILVSMVPHSASATNGATCRTNVGSGPGFGFGASVGGYNMVNVIAHELIETATDPIGNSWYRDGDHFEVADLCAWNFGPLKTASNYKYNVQLGSKYFLIQQAFDLKTGRCALA